jgi:hypothetical protein
MIPPNNFLGATWFKKFFHASTFERLKDFMKRRIACSVDFYSGKWANLVDRVQTK